MAKKQKNQQEQVTPQKPTLVELQAAAFRVDQQIKELQRRYNLVL